MYNKRVLTKAVSELGKAKKPANKRDKIIAAERQQTPIVSTEGFKQGPPPLGYKYRIPGDTLYNPTPYTIEAVSDNGIRKILNPYDIDNTYFSGANFVEENEKKEEGGEYYDDELTQEEIDDLIAQGYVVESLPKAQTGQQIYTYADRPEARYKKDAKGNWLIMLPSTNGEYVPIKDPSGKRAGELNEKAKPLKFNMPNIISAEEKYHDAPIQSADWLWTLPVGLPAVTQTAGAVGVMSLPGMSSIPGATVGNLVNSGFIANSLYNTPSNAKEWYDVTQGKKNWTDAAIGSAEIAAGLFGSGAGFKSLAQDAKGLGKTIPTSRVVPQPVNPNKKVLDYMNERGLLPQKPVQSYGNMIGNQMDWDNYIKEFYEGSGPIYVAPAKNRHLAEGYYLPGYNFDLGKGGRGLKPANTGLFGMPAENLSDFVPAESWNIFDTPISKNKKGGSLLTKKVTCKDCGWTWDAADGGNDLTTCHKCGGKGLVHAQFGFGMDKLRKRKVDKQKSEEAPAFGQPLPTDPQGAPYAFVGERPACGEGEVWDENMQSCVNASIQELPTMYASANPETNKKRTKFIDKANALWDTVEGRKVWMENGPKNYSLNELSKFVHNVKDYKDQAAVYEKYRRMAQDKEISGDEFGRLYRENNWGRFDQNTGRENFKGEWKQAVEKGNQEKAEYAKRMGKDIANTLGEYSGVNSVIRTVTNPIDTLSDAGQTIVDIGMTAPQVPYMAYDYLSNLFTPWNREYGNEYSGTEDINPVTGQPYWSGSQGAIDLVTSLPFFKGAAAVGNTGFKAGVNAVNRVQSQGLTSQGLVDDALRATTQDVRLVQNPGRSEQLGADAYDVYRGNQKVGEVSGNKTAAGDFEVTDIGVDPQFQKQGVGQEIYKQLNQSLPEGNRVKSWGAFVENNGIKPGEKTWQALEREGLAVKNDKGVYEMVPAKQTSAEAGTVSQTDDAILGADDTYNAPSRESMERYNQMIEHFNKHIFLPESKSLQGRELLDDFISRINSKEGLKRLGELGINDPKYFEDLVLKEIQHEAGYFTTVGGQPIIALHKDIPESIVKNITRHEIEHAVQRALLGPVGTTEIDEMLKGITLKGTPNGAVPREMTWNAIEFPKNAELFPDAQKNLNYYAFGSNGKEKSAFLAEVQQGMLDNGIIDDVYENITPEKVKKAYKQFIEDPNPDKYAYRFFEIMEPTEANFELTSKALNKMLAIPGAIGGVGTAGYMMNQGATEQPTEGLKKGGSVSKKYSRSLEAKNQLYVENRLVKKRKPKTKKIFSPTSPYFQPGGSVIPQQYTDNLQNFERPIVKNSSHPGYNALTNTIEQDPSSPIENVNNPWWNQHELFHHLQNTAGGMSTSGQLGQRPNPYVASDEAIHGYYDRRDNDVQDQINQMISADPSLQFIPRHLLTQSIYPEGSEEPSFVGADALMYTNPSTVEGEARAYENYIRQGGKPFLAKGGVPNLPLNKNRKVLRDWTYGQSIGMLQEANGGILYAQAGLNLQGIRTAPVKTTTPPKKEVPVKAAPTPAATQMNLQGIRTAPVVTHTQPKKEEHKNKNVKPAPQKLSGFDMMHEIHNMYNTKIADAKNLRPENKEEQRRRTSPLEVFTGTNDLFKSYTTADQKEQTESPLDMFGHVNDAFNEAANKPSDRVPNQQGSPLDMFGQVNDAFRTFNADHKVVNDPSTLDMFGNINKAFDEAADKNIKLAPYDVKNLFKQGLVGQMDQKGLFTKSDDKQKLEDAINSFKDNQGLGSYIDAVGNTMHDLGFDYGQYALNGIKRKLTKLGWIEEQEQQTSSNIDMPRSVEEYYKNPGMLKEEFMVPGSSRKYHQQSMPLSNIKLGFRNRGDYKNINTEGLELTTFHPFTKTLNNSDNKSVFAIDPQGNLHTGKYKDLKNNKGWRFSATFMNKIVNIEDSYLDGARSGNAGYMQPKIKTIDDNGNIKYGAMNILTKGKGKDDYYGSIQGGRVLFVNPKTKEQFLVSGSLAHIKSEFKRLKGDNKYLEAWTLDNGTYSRGLSYKDKKLTPDRLKKYDNENGSGGNGLYIMNYKAPVNKFKEEYVKNMPNIRNKTDESYKKGHALKNEVKNIVLHHTAYEDENLNDKQVREQYMKKGSSSSHVVIEENGKRTIYASPEQVTFHAGKSKWKGREDVNDFSVGVEFQGNTNKKPLTNAQIESFVEYYTPIAKRYNLSLKDIITHQMVAPGRKPDITDADYKRILNYMKQQGFR